MINATWPNGVDLAPDAMFDEIKAASGWVPKAARSAAHAAR